MDKKEIAAAILSKDETRITEAKQAIKEMLNARSAHHKGEITKFISKSLFESEGVA